MKKQQAKRQEKIATYHAVFDPAEEGGYNVSFPAFPGCVTYGNTFEEARHYAQEVLELWLEVLAENGEEITTYNGHPIIDEIQARLPA